MSFKKGISNNGNGGGRPKGVRNKLSHAFVTALAKDFEEFGEGVIKVLRAESPSDYLRLVAGLVPREIDLEINRAVEVREWMQWVVQTPSNVQTITKSEKIGAPSPTAYLSKPKPPPRLRHEPWSESEHARNEPVVDKPRLQITPRKSDSF